MARGFRMGSGGGSNGPIKKPYYLIEDGIINDNLILTNAGYQYDATNGRLIVYAVPPTNDSLYVTPNIDVSNYSYLRCLVGVSDGNWPVYVGTMIDGTWDQQYTNSAYATLSRDVTNSNTVTNFQLWSKNKAGIVFYIYKIWLE